MHGARQSKTCKVVQHMCWHALNSGNASRWGRKAPSKGQMQEVGFVRVFAQGRHFVSVSDKGDVPCLPPLYFVWTSEELQGSLRPGPL